MRRLQVVKIGTSSVFRDGTIDYLVLLNLGYDLAKLRFERETDSVLVVSGAIVLGREKISSIKKLNETVELQASVGQHYLMRHYTYGLSQGYNRYVREKEIYGLELITSQIMVTYDYLSYTQNRRQTIKLLNDSVDIGVLPLVNNDDIKDPSGISNDNIAAIIAKNIIADRLVILTDVEGLLDRGGNLVLRVSYIDESIKALCRNEGSGVGAMQTKLEAAELLLKEGITTIIGNIKYGLVEIIDTEKIRTIFTK